ncbi:GPI transamidase subunit PIG-U [Planctomycetes bacterium Pla163]|uniref:GPI transamidase subunit PIG-U n=1 Tax=Rohdeia mirabilis TaxID=2528008 RepID=A0A518CZT1_9BACT|nr:GPI transamidase subunit PIG-U [Planctomycetes bacterium Pla163]
MEPSTRGTTDQRNGRATRVAAALAFVLALLVKLPQLGFGHREPDEVIYWQLAQRLWQDGVYSLRGTLMLERLPAAMYDHGLFHHPPLFAALLGPWAVGDAGPYPPSSAIWITWIAHALFAAATVHLGLRLAAENRRRPLGSILCASASAACVFDPFGWFASRFLWIDSVSMALAALAVAVAFGATSRRRFVLAGVLCGCAGLAKLTGLVVLLPVVAERLLRDDGERARRGGDLAALLLPATALVGGWSIVFWSATGALLPTWIAPDAEVLARDALMAEGFGRSPATYLWLVPAVQPLVLWTAAALAIGQRSSCASVRPLVLWFAVGGAAIAATGWLGTTPVLTRQLAPIYPALYALAIVALSERRTVAWRATFVLATAVGALNGALAVYGTSVYELSSVLLGAPGR